MQEKCYDYLIFLVILISTLFKKLLLVIYARDWYRIKSQTE